ncbi:putative ER lumen protein-retaining receptor C28H8.4 [Phalaenopsis equestris]|uniref:putative ER lumen protein-retaining receptor C28H8.4 n=1 Tax=Phalaenopsis equestris TaxID=78828 RepID=UPI0009E3D972|nr:putative ER lumen protein-retaining receptor C28H8.4 [Phalaenopsis equestris]
MGRRRGTKGPVGAVYTWVRGQSVKAKTALGALAALVVLAALWALVHNHNHFFVASEAVHAAGIIVLIYKLSSLKTCSGLSLKSQELTAIFLAVRFYCSVIIEKDVHTVLDLLTLFSTIWVIYMMRFKLNSSYTKELDNMPTYYLLVPSIVLAIFVHPFLYKHHSRFLWAFSVYLESVSVLPQLRLMQNAKMVEPFTAHYVFALGVARFLNSAHWIIKVVDTGGSFLTGSSSAVFWTPAVLIAELVQTLILADFCYYYIKSAMLGQLMRLPSAHGMRDI